MFPGTGYPDPPLVNEPSAGTPPPVAPFAEYVTTYVTAVHFTYSVTSADPIVSDEPPAYDVPLPDGAAFHPSNV